MLDVYNERLADIVLSSKESAEENCIPQPRISKEKAVIVLNNVSFGYGDQYPVLSDVSFSIMPGEVVAIVGRSGSGKTTIAKLILGIYKPTNGNLATFGIDSKFPNYIYIRRLIGAVLQDDKLFRGSIIDNIAMFSDTQDISWAEHCASLAHIHEEIISFPMGYQTLVGEMGGTLSGGQRQRLLLARALYKRPKLLILDEATSHLDVASEMIISQTLRQLDLPVLLIAHRPETIASADRVISIV